MSQRKILTGIAIFIASYMIAALGWWTFSLLRYSETEFLMEQKILSSEQRICIEDIATEFDVEYHHENKYFLSTVVSKNKLKEILSRMDNLPYPILNDLFTLLHIDLYEKQQVGFVFIYMIILISSIIIIKYFA